MSDQPSPPTWAIRTVDERGRIVHELVSSRHPMASVDFIEGARPTDVSVAVSDVRGHGGWERQGPTVQVEGGSYTINDAWQLCQALRELLSLVQENEPSE